MSLTPTVCARARYSIFKTEPYMRDQVVCICAQPQIDPPQSPPFPASSEQSLISQ